MDTNVLAEQRRETVINLLKGMKIKKTDGDGYDKEDVYLCIQQLCDVYEKNIEDLTANYDGQIAELQDKYQKYDENNELYISLIMEAKKSSNEIITKAKAEVDEIIASGKEQIAKQEAEIEELRKTAEQERADLQAESVKAREDADKEKNAIAEEVNKERERAEEAKETYRRRLEAMEQEFDEIKTNILRTAGKIDGLKAQISEQEVEKEWVIQDMADRVDMPEPDVAVEGAVEVEAPSTNEVELPEVEETSEPGEKLSFEDLVAKLESEDFANELTETPEPADAVDVAQPEEPDVTEIDFSSIAADFNTQAEEPAPSPALSFEPEIPQAQVEAPQETGLGDLEKLAAEELEIKLPEVESTEVETPIEEISFEGLEELFKE